MQQAQRGKKLASKEKQKTERIAKQQSWNHCIKRVQRYLGLREIRRGHHALTRSGLENSGLQWADYDAAVKATAALLPPPAAFVADQPAPFTRELDVVFVCVDVEAYERNASIITEIGIATLDTRELASVILGEGGANWMKIIRARHFRINEHKHYQNGEFVKGCADRFEFGYRSSILRYGNFADVQTVRASSSTSKTRPTSSPTALNIPFQGMETLNRPPKKI